MITGNFYINAKQSINSESTLSAKQYTTSEKGDLRLSYVRKQIFEAHKQPVEIESGIFINQNKKFQTILGI